MSAIFRDSGAPSFLAPRVVCDFFEQRIAEDEVTDTDVVRLSEDWWYDAMAHSLVFIPHQVRA